MTNPEQLRQTPPTPEVLEMIRNAPRRNPRKDEGGGDDMMFWSDDNPFELRIPKSRPQ
jgi:hypothetical protein